MAAAEAPTPFELSRRIDEIQRDLREARQELRQLEGRVVPSDLFQAELRRVSDHLDVMDDNLRKTAEAHEQSVAQARQTRRYYVASVVIPLLIVLATLIPVLLVHK